MSVNMSFTINATSANELRRAIQELAAVIETSARETQMNASTTVTQRLEPAATEKLASSSTEPPAQEHTAEAPSVSMEDVRAKLASLVQAGKQTQVKELLASFGAEKLSQVPPERYGELMAKAGELG